MAEKNLIKLILFQDTGSIWDVTEWKKVRHHKLIGKFIGCLAQQPYQVKENGFPLLLTKNETTLLLEKHLAVLVTSKHLSSCPDNGIIDCYRKSQQDSFTIQSALLQEERKLEIMDRSELIITGKLKKRRKLDPKCVIEDSDRTAIINEEISKISEPSQSYMYIEIPTVDPWVEKKDLENEVWSYPKTEEEKLEYATFRTLWEEEFWVTPGAKFGGNFLAYRGDPLLFHSSYIVRCVKPTEALNLLDLITLSRLATSTNKTPVLAYFGSDDKIHFQSLSWIN